MFCKVVRVMASLSAARFSRNWHARKYLCGGVASTTSVAVQDKGNFIHSRTTDSGAPAAMSRAKAIKQAARISSGDADCKAPLCSNGAYVGKGTEMYNIPGKRAGVRK